MAASVHIREAVGGDFERWCDLYEIVAAERIWIGGEPPVDRERRRRFFDSQVGSDDHVILIAEQAGEQVGHLGIETRRGIAELGMLVAPEARGAGVGTALLRACLDWCRAHAVHKVALQVWPHNLAARVLYERFGFVEEGRLVRHYRRQSGELWDAVLMGLVLDTTSPGSSL